MSTMTKVFVVLNAVLAIALSCLFVAAAAQWDNYRELNDTLQAGRDAAVAQAQSTSAMAQASLALKDQELAAKDAQLGQARDDNAGLTDELAQVRAELAEVKSERLSAEAGRTKLREILDVTTGELKSLQMQNQTLLTQNIDLQSRNSRLNSRVLELQTGVTILTDQVRNIQEKLYAAEQLNTDLQQRVGQGPSKPVVDIAGGATAVAPTVAGEIRGRITDVSGTYATIDVGAGAGVVKGLTFMVHRADGTYLGDLIVETVWPDQAGGKLTTLVQGEVRSGDAVVYGMN